MVVVAQGFKRLVKSVVPAHVIPYIIRYRDSVHEIRVERILKKAAKTPVFLDMAHLERLQAEYPFPAEYGYDPESLETRGTIRAKQLLNVPGASQAESFLELGCGDGMVSCILHRTGKKTIAIDISTDRFDSRARQEGVTMLLMDAADLAFQDGTFDFAFSYDGFEHFSKPESVFGEVVRVVKPGGYIYIAFGPLYMSPMGQHAYRSITVPYCQFLFSRTTLEEFVNKAGLSRIKFDFVNGWSIQQFRQLWTTYEREAERIQYREETVLSHLDLIERFPSCFKSRSDSLDNFIVSGIQVVFRKRDAV